MEQEVQITLTLGLSVDASLSKTQIIRQLRKQIESGNSDKMTVVKMKVDKVKEEAEIYNNQ